MDDINIDVEGVEGKSNTQSQYDPIKAKKRQERQNKTNEELQFQDIPHDSYANDKGNVQTHTFTDFPNTAESEEEEIYDKTELLKEKTSPSFWTFEYYQQFFDVETYQVLHRILGSMLPLPRNNYLKTKIRPNPDLYGPFWICTTLVFTTAIAGNLANYLGSQGKNYQWQYDFRKVTFAATVIFSYWWLIPGCLFGFLWWRGRQAGYTFLEILCVYGYSLAIYIPISILWVIQFNWFQWLLVIIGTVLSGGVLLLTFWPAVRDDTKKVAWAVIITIFILHAALAVGFKLYFFQVPVHVPSPAAPTITSTIAHNLTNPAALKLGMLTHQPNAMKKTTKPQKPAGANNNALPAKGETIQAPKPVATNPNKPDT